MEKISLFSDGSIEADEAEQSASPLALLGSRLFLTDDFTLRSFLLMIRDHPPFEELSPFLPGFLESLRQGPDRTEPTPELDALLLQKRVHLVGAPGKPSLEICTLLQGMKGGTDREIKDYTLEELFDLPLRLGRARHVLFGDSINGREFEAVFTLFELIDTVAWQLSFHGMPAACKLRR